MGSYRVGRRNPHVIYWQAGQEPDHERDRSLGYIADAAEARIMVRRANAWLEHVRPPADRPGA